jgi:hypothetical protein
MTYAYPAWEYAAESRLLKLGTSHKAVLLRVPTDCLHYISQPYRPPRTVTRIAILEY